MGRIIQFEEQGIAHLRQRLGAAEEARSDLLAFARGHSGAVASIHQAVLAAIRCDDADDLFAAVTRQWPAILGIDTVVLCLAIGPKGFRIHSSGIDRVDPAFLARAMAGAEGVTFRNAERGHPLFGPGADRLKSEALVRIAGEPGLPCGILALGQETEQAVDPRHGSDLLLFLGDTLAAMLRRCLVATRP